MYNIAHTITNYMQLLIITLEKHVQGFFQRGGTFIPIVRIIDIIITHENIIISTFFSRSLSEFYSMRSSARKKVLPI